MRRGSPVSYRHIHAIYNHFQGTSRERLVLLVYAYSINAESGTGVTDAKLASLEVARRAGIDPADVRRIVRKYEGTKPGEVEPGKWFYPAGKPAKQGDVTPSRYWMPIEPDPVPRVKRPAHNPHGINKPRLQEPGDSPRLQEPVAQVTGTGGQVTGTSGGGVPVTSPHGLQEPTSGTSRKESGTGGIPPHPPKHSASDLRAWMDYATRMRGERLKPLPLKEWLNQGASPPNPPAQAERQAMGENQPDQADRLPDGARQLDLADFIEPTIITDHQDQTP